MNYFIFQQLYTILNRFIRLVVTNLAKFHAANFALIEEMGREEFRMKFALQITEGFDFSETSMMGPMFDNGISTCMKILEVAPLHSLLPIIKGRIIIMLE